MKQPAVILVVVVGIPPLADVSLRKFMVKGHVFVNVLLLLAYPYVRVVALGLAIETLREPVFIHKRRVQSNFLIRPILSRLSKTVDGLMTA